MKPLLILFSIFFILASTLHAQEKEEQGKKLKFCGFRYKDTVVLRRQMEAQVQFIGIRDNDSVVDIGSSSGAYIGALNVIAPFKHVHFILVDLDTNCMNKTKVFNMISHYEALRGIPFDNTISFVNNTADSLYLPSNRFKKVLLFNTLHEIDDKQDMARQMAGIMCRGGELLVAELMPTPKEMIHKGCRKPLIGEKELVNLFMPFGLVLVDQANLQVNSKQKEKHPYMFYKFIKN
jgi:ubiquinone/menaquinone biosynthesis C-methylase UbiE